jgi:hypothetical protein
VLTNVPGVDAQLFLAARTIHEIPDDWRVDHGFDLRQWNELRREDLARR